MVRCDGNLFLRFLEWEPTIGSQIPRPHRKERGDKDGATSGQDGSEVLPAHLLNAILQHIQSNVSFFFGHN